MAKVISKKEIEECIMNVAIKVANRKEGALFIVGNVESSPLIDQKIKKFNILDNPKLLESLALMDGAVIINHNGTLKTYGALVKTVSVFKNFGTRHSAAATASRNKNNFVLLVSEEDRKIRIFKAGKIIMQIDPEHKDVKKSISYVSNLLESIGVGTVGTVGVGILAPTLGVALLPGVVVFGAIHFFGKKILKVK